MAKFRKVRRCGGVLIATMATVPWVHSASGQQTGQQRGVTLGGLAGAIAGSIIGENNDEPVAGALIGGAVGAVTGGVLGNANDRDRAANMRPQFRQRCVQCGPPTPSRVATPIVVQQADPIVVQPAEIFISTNDVVAMSRSGVSDQVIINEIRKRGVGRSLQVNDIIALHQQGVSEPVITELQRGTIATQRVARPASGDALIYQQPPSSVDRYGNPYVTVPAHRSAALRGTAPRSPRPAPRYRSSADWNYWRSR